MNEGTKVSFVRIRMERGIWLRTSSAALLWLTLAGSSVLGQQWAKGMFDHTSHDFGTVAKGAKVEHRFVIENIYQEDVHILSVTSSCGCTRPTITKRMLKTWEKAEIVAKIDTRGYYGRKDATLTVVLDVPALDLQSRPEVRLQVHTYIRSDIVVQPGSVQFGSVTHGTAAERRLTISYAGRPDWRIQKVESNHPHLEAQVVRSDSTTPRQVTYELVVKLKDDAPVGYIRDHLILVTNDRRARVSRVPIAVEGVVVSAVTVHPSPLLLGVVSAGGTVTRQLVVKGEKAFRIRHACCVDKRFKCTVPEKEQSLHLIPVTFTAGETTGKVSAKIRIETDLAAGEVLVVPVHVQVMPQGSPTR